MELKKLPFGGQTMVAPLKTVVLKRPLDAFRSSQTIESEWKDLDYLCPPDLERAAQDHQQFLLAHRRGRGEGSATCPTMTARVWIPSTLTTPS